MTALFPFLVHEKRPAEAGLNFRMNAGNSVVPGNRDGLFGYDKKESIVL
jgi:hypothetical protein